MKHLHYFILVSLFFLSTARAEEYYLQPNETVSDLLYKRLKYKRIYGEGGVLQKVLEENSLTFKKSKTLPIGYPIFIKKSEEAPPKIEHVPVVQPADQPVAEQFPEETPQRLFIINGGVSFFNLQGKSRNSNFKIYTVIPEVGIGHSHSTSKRIARVSWDLAYLKFADSSANRGNTSFITSSLEGALLKKSEMFNFGGFASIKTDVFMNTSAGDTYKIISPWFYSLGPQIEWQRKEGLYILKLD